MRTLALSLLLAAPAAAVPLAIPHQGSLHDGADVPLTGTYALTFTLHTVETDPTSNPPAPIWTRAYPAVSVFKGIYQVNLGEGGSGDALTDAIFDTSSDLFLQIKVGDDVLTPRMHVGSTAYAFFAGRAASAQKLGDKTLADLRSEFAPASGSGDYIRAGTTAQNVSFNLGTGSATAGALTVNGAAQLNGDANVTGDADVDGDLGVGGALSGGAASFSSLAVSGGSQIHGLDVTGNVTATGTLNATGTATFGNGFSSETNSRVKGTLTVDNDVNVGSKAALLGTGTLTLDTNTLSAAQLGTLIGGAGSNADALHRHADTGTAFATNATLAPNATLDVPHGFATSNVTASLWVSRDTGTTWELAQSARPDAADTGDGSDAALTVSTTVSNVNAYATASGTAGQTTLAVSATAGFATDRKVLIIQMQGDGAGRYEENEVATVGGTLVLKRPLQFDYASAGANHAQVLAVAEYTNVTVNSGGRITAPAWNGSIGGIVAFKANGTVTINAGGDINVAGAGFRGGAAGPNPRDRNNLNCNSANTTEIAPFPGESIAALPATPWAFYAGGTNNCGVTLPNFGGGAPGMSNNAEGMTGGNGGSHGTTGAFGHSAYYAPVAGQLPASTYGSPDMATLFLGSGGGGGSAGYNGANTPGGYATNTGSGGNGGGMIMVTAATIVNRGRILATGAVGGYGSWYSSSSTNIINGGGGGGGSGGAIWLRAGSIDAGFVSAGGGAGGQSSPTQYGSWNSSPDGGDGGDGRVRTDVLGRGGFLVTQPNLNTVRVTNQSGAAANVRLVVRR